MKNTTHDCGGPLDGWGLSPLDVARFLSEITNVLRLAMPAKEIAK